VTSAAIPVGHKGTGGRGRTALPRVPDFSFSFRDSALTPVRNAACPAGGSPSAPRSWCPPLVTTKNRLAPPMRSGEGLHHRAERVAVGVGAARHIAQALDAIQGDL
jgi:hypothetical protein